MAAVSAPPPQRLAGPVVTCPYTAGGCPLFQTVDVSESSRCAGSCSPAAPTMPLSPRPAPSASASSSSSMASKRPAPWSFTYGDAALLSELTGDIGLPLPSALLKQDAWQGYLDWSISPKADQLEMPFLAPNAVPPLLPSPRNQLWDLEDLLPASNDHKRPRTTPPPLPSAGDASASVEYPNANPPASTTPGRTDSPRADDEEGEVVTPFISKLSYLLTHEEYSPWVRWDSTGDYLLVAHNKPHLLHILERFFRHTVTSSFIRQLNIYGFKRATTAQLLNILDSTPYAASVTLPDGTTEHFSAADFSAFANPLFFRDEAGAGAGAGAGGRHCRLGALKPITKERAPRVRGKKALAAAAASGGGARRKGGLGSASASATPPDSP